MTSEDLYPVLSFVVPGEPVPKGRPRFYARGGRVHVMTPEATVAYEKRVAAAARQAANDIGGWRVGQRVPLSLDVISVHKRPGRLFRIADEGFRAPKTTKPDADNVLKAVMDGLQRAQLFNDDSQIASVACRKVYARIIDRRERSAEASFVHVTLQVMPALDDFGAENLLQHG
tara:strand:+ start:1278 stop:1796 length:519 start_codon:yes stop_codon:yes gene_type:complete